MQRDVLAGLPRHVRPAARVVLRLCETHLQSRGVIKRSFLQCFDVARAAARRLGEIHHQAGALDDPEHVFYLTADELLGELPSDASGRVSKSTGQLPSTPKSSICVASSICLALPGRR
jgi:hypothetical protein